MPSRSETTPTTMSPPVHVGLPLPDAVPVGGCAHCDRYERDRDRARAAGDWSAESDAHVLWRWHSLRAHGWSRSV
ncbi:hypothetical protein SAMN05192584_12849 [Streptomyces pini]|uniref:Uncharacterized protein n=1 Tax=Streptomyces pini TaxID=1520580 RepID=A0A1I4KVV8_9ACTN|nr:hypothetical protein SAMN05192584_12849 [Streptomyces pini]